MKFRLVLLVALCLALFAAPWAAAQEAEEDEGVTYEVAHVKYRTRTWVFVLVEPEYFRGTHQEQTQWWQGLKQCAAESGLQGNVVAVAEARGRFRYFGARDMIKFVQDLNMDWISENVNTELTCY